MICSCFFAVRNMLDVAERYDAKTFIELARNAGVVDKLQTKKDISIFIPNDSAFAGMVIIVYCEF